MSPAIKIKPKKRPRKKPAKPIPKLRKQPWGHHNAEEEEDQEKSA